MLTVTVSSDYTEIYVESDNITTWLSEFGANTTTLELTVRYNCNQEVQLTLDENNLDAGNTRYVLTPDVFTMGTTFCDGVYFFQLKTTTIATGDFVTENECLFLDALTKCTLMEYVADYLKVNNNKISDELIVAQGVHKSLEYLGLCSDCNCEDACTLFEYLTNQIGQDINAQTVGCANC
jgi:hypothetical protein